MPFFNSELDSHSQAARLTNEPFETITSSCRKWRARVLGGRVFRPKGVREHVVLQVSRCLTCSAIGCRAQHFDRYAMAKHLEDVSLVEITGSQLASLNRTFRCESWRSLWICDLGQESMEDLPALLRSLGPSVSSRIELPTLLAGRAPSRPSLASRFRSLSASHTPQVVLCQ